MPLELATADELAAEMEPQQRPSGLNVRFFIEVQENEERTKKEGRRVFEDVEMVEIRVPGEIDILRHPATLQDREQYAAHYERFKASQTQEKVEGFPLSEWAMMRRSQVEEARTRAVHSIEQLATIPDVTLQRFGPGWIDLRQHARDWVKNAKGGSETVRLRSEVQSLTVKVKTLETMLTRQAAELHRDTTQPAIAPQYITPPDDRMAKLEAMVAKLVSPPATITITAPPKAEAPKRRGRPPGSKNKPKETPPQ
jgi:hypothetical protein